MFETNPKFLLDIANFSSENNNKTVRKIGIFFDEIIVKVLKLLQYIFIPLAYTTENKN